MYIPNHQPVIHHCPFQCKIAWTLRPATPTRRSAVAPGSLCLGDGCDHSGTSACLSPRRTWEMEKKVVQATKLGDSSNRNGDRRRNHSRD